MKVSSKRGRPGRGAVAPVDRRQNVILVIALLVSVVFAGRLVYVQGIIGPSLASAAARERSVTTELLAPRGEIISSDGVVLASSTVTYDLILDLDQIPSYKVTDADGDVIGRGAAALAPQLAEILDRNTNELGAALVGDPSTSTGRKYFVLARNVSPEVRQQVAALRIPGFDDEPRSTRSYHNGTVAGTLLGWVNSAGEGVVGLEDAYQDLLIGTNGTETYEQGAGGQLIPSGGQDQTAAVPGCDLNLTIDTDIQYIAQQVIDEAVKTYGAEWAAISVMQTSTGRLLALADSDSYDPGDPPEARYADPNEVLAPSYQAQYEPGSTGKVLTVTAALEEGVITPETPIEDPYQLTTPNGQTFHDSHEHPDQVLTPAGVLAESANTGTVHIGSEMSDQTRFEYMQLMGWGQSTGLGLVGESDGAIYSPDSWDGRQRYTTMFGQGIAVSLLQNTGVFNTLGNQGMHVDPVLVDGWTCDGEYTANEVAEPQQVVSPETASTMIRMLESVTEDGGTGTSAAVEGYRVAGKTGTAQTADGAGGITATTASFVGIVPADDPQLTIGVVIYKPTSGFFGGTIAAPAFHDVAAFALPDLGIAPSGEPADPYPLTPGGDTD